MCKSCKQGCNCCRLLRPRCGASPKYVLPCLLEVPGLLAWARMGQLGRGDLSTVHVYDAARARAAMLPQAHSSSAFIHYTCGDHIESLKLLRHVERALFHIRAACNSIIPASAVRPRLGVTRGLRTSLDTTLSQLSRHTVGSQGHNASHSVPWLGRSSPKP